MKETKSARQIRIKKILSLLAKEFPDAWCSLHYKNPLQLLISTILSAQCTDARVNMVAPELFAKYKTAADFAHARVIELESIIRSTGFYHSKAKNIINCCKKIVGRHGGKVPATMEELVTLDGVGRKTANIVTFHAFNKAHGIAIDTHAFRITRRLGFSSANSPEKMEKELMLLLPSSVWGAYTNYMVLHGRKYCMARKPDCKGCPLNKLCPSTFKTK
jgi:endonuclease III